jgi:hypothetical protein
MWYAVQSTCPTHFLIEEHQKLPITVLDGMTHAAYRMSTLSENYAHCKYVFQDILAVFLTLTPFFMTNQQKTEGNQQLQHVTEKQIKYSSLLFSRGGAEIVWAATF